MQSPSAQDITGHNNYYRSLLYADDNNKYCWRVCAPNRVHIRVDVLHFSVRLVLFIATCLIRTPTKIISNNTIQESNTCTCPVVMWVFYSTILERTSCTFNFVGYDVLFKS